MFLKNPRFSMLMVTKKLLTDRQRFEIENYLSTMPDAAPDYIRGLRAYCRDLDFKQMESDLTLMKKLANLSVKMGRKRLKDSRDQKVVMKIRKSAAVDAKAVLTVKKGG